jgi:hypothetical protein
VCVCVFLCVWLCACRVVSCRVCVCVCLCVCVCVCVPQRGTQELNTLVKLIKTVVAIFASSGQFKILPLRVFKILPMNTHCTQPGSDGPIQRHFF